MCVFFCFVLFWVFVKYHMINSVQGLKIDLRACATTRAIPGLPTKGLKSFSNFQQLIQVVVMRKKTVIYRYVWCWCFIKPLVDVDGLMRRTRRAPPWTRAIRIRGHRRHTPSRVSFRAAVGSMYCALTPWHQRKAITASSVRPQRSPKLATFRWKSGVKSLKSRVRHVVCLKLNRFRELDLAHRLKRKALLAATTPIPLDQASRLMYSSGKLQQRDEMIRLVFLL